MISRKVESGSIGISSNSHNNSILLQVTSDTPHSQSRARMTIEQAKKVSERLVEEILRMEVNRLDEEPISKIGAGETVEGSSPSASAKENLKEIMDFVIAEGIKNGDFHNLRIDPGMLAGRYKESKFRIFYIADQPDTSFAGVIAENGNMQQAVDCKTLEQFLDEINYQTPVAF